MAFGNKILLMSSKTFVIDSFYYKFLIFFSSLLLLFSLAGDGPMGPEDASFMIRDGDGAASKPENIPPHISADIKANGFFALHKYSNSFPT